MAQTARFVITVIAATLVLVYFQLASVPPPATTPATTIVARSSNSNINIKGDSAAPTRNEKQQLPQQQGGHHSPPPKGTTQSQEKAAPVSYNEANLRSLREQLLQVQEAQEQEQEGQEGEKDGGGGGGGGSKRESAPLFAKLDFQLMSLKVPLEKAASRLRPHHLATFEQVQRAFPVPVQESCPSSVRPDTFCTPSIGRDWTPKMNPIVYPISYSLPDDLYISAPAVASLNKTDDCSVIVPRERATYNFKSENDYMDAYRRSYYCLTYKKGGWDVLRHYEIIAAGCMPYWPDIEYAPEYTLYHLPRRLLLEARELPGVYFNCSTARVSIDHAVFPHQRYRELLVALLAHAHRHLTTTAMARYALRALGLADSSSFSYDDNSNKKKPPPKILYIARGGGKTALRAQGNYNSWTLFLGLRALLGTEGCVDSHVIDFLYDHQSPRVKNATKWKLYGNGFGYAFRLKEPPSVVNRTGLLERIRRKEFDAIIFGDPTSLISPKAKLTTPLAERLGFLREVLAAGYNKSKIAFVHAPDIPYPSPQLLGYSTAELYRHGLVFQREIPDCSYYFPVVSQKGRQSSGVAEGTASPLCRADVSYQQLGSSAAKKKEQQRLFLASCHATPSLMMKRCVWYRNRNCFDDVNVVEYKFDAKRLFF